MTPEAFFDLLLASEPGPDPNDKGATVEGALVLSLLDSGHCWSLRMNPRLQIDQGREDDRLVEIGCSSEDFEALSAQLLTDQSTFGSHAPLIRQRLMARRGDVEHLRKPIGTVALAITDQGRERWVFGATGGGAIEAKAPVCVVRVDLTDLTQMLRGEVLPLQLLLGGRIVIEGDAQAIMLLFSAFAP